MPRVVLCFAMAFLRMDSVVGETSLDAVLASIDGLNCRRAEKAYLRKEAVRAAVAGGHPLADSLRVTFERLLAAASGAVGGRVAAPKLQALLARLGHRPLAQRVRRLADARKVEAHPDVTLGDEVVAALSVSTLIGLGQWAGSLCDVPIESACPPVSDATDDCSAFTSAIAPCESIPIESAAAIAMSGTEAPLGRCGVGCCDGGPDDRLVACTCPPGGDVSAEYAAAFPLAPASSTSVGEPWHSVDRATLQTYPTSCAYALGGPDESKVSKVSLLATSTPTCCAGRQLRNACAQALPEPLDMQAGDADSCSTRSGHPTCDTLCSTVEAEHFGIKSDTDEHVGAYCGPAIVPVCCAHDAGDATSLEDRALAMASDRVSLDPFAAPDDIVIDVLEHFECELASMQLLDALDGMLHLRVQRCQRVVASQLVNDELECAALPSGAHTLIDPAACAHLPSCSAAAPSNAAAMSIAPASTVTVVRRYRNRCCGTNSEGRERCGGRDPARPQAHQEEAQTP